MGLKNRRSRRGSSCSTRLPRPYRSRLDALAQAPDRGQTDSPSSVLSPCLCLYYHPNATGYLPRPGTQVDRAREPSHYPRIPERNKTRWYHSRGCCSPSLSSRVLFTPYTWVGMVLLPTKSTLVVIPTLPVDTARLDQPDLAGNPFLLCCQAFSSKAQDRGLRWSSVGDIMALLSK